MTDRQTYKQLSDLIKVSLVPLRYGTPKKNWFEIRAHYYEATDKQKSIQTQRQTHYCLKLIKPLFSRGLKIVEVKGTRGMVRVDT